MSSKHPSRHVSRPSSKPFPVPTREFGSGKRIVWVMYLLCVLFTSLGYRAYQLQVRQRETLLSMVHATQYIQIRQQAQRGTIYDRNMAPLALSVKVDSLVANPRKVGKELDAARKLSRILDLPSREIYWKLTRDSSFVWLKRRLTKREVQAVRRLPFFSKLRLESESQRVYPNGKLGAHLLGGVGNDGKGLGAAELAMDPLLRGKALSIRRMRDPKGRKLLRMRDLEMASKRGADLVLTIDKNIQFIAERAMERAMEKTRAKRGIAVVMEPNTGDILALVIKPDFDPNAFTKTKAVVRNNAALSNPYEPGSTMKPITMAIAMNLGLVKPGERINDEGGRMRIGRRTIRDDHPKRRPISPLEIIKYSSNICSAKIGFRLGKERFHKHLKEFGFGQRTDLGLPGESRGILRSPHRWSQIALANIAFGQGIAVTPIQLTAAINAIASDGLYYKPRLFKQIIDPQGKITRKFDTPPRRVLSASVARRVALMMESVVGHPDGTGKSARVEGIRAGGKTGTAQKPIPGGRGYGKERIGSFVGFAPVDQPRLSVLVVIDEPKSACKYGGCTAAPAWSEIVRDSLRYMGVIAGEPVRFAPIQHVMKVADQDKLHVAKKVTPNKKKKGEKKSKAPKKDARKKVARANAKKSKKSKKAKSKERSQHARKQKQAKAQRQRRKKHARKQRKNKRKPRRRKPSRQSFDAW
ncbi:MAG: penicillin-binding protein 2 [Myxococcales bacterium]|nr:penicillin-binding protein 2 [Myxococcales bacterium]